MAMPPCHDLFCAMNLSEGIATWWAAGASTFVGVVAVSVTLFQSFDAKIKARKDLARRQLNAAQHALSALDIMAKLQGEHYERAQSSFDRFFGVKWQFELDRRLTVLRELIKVQDFDFELVEQLAAVHHHILDCHGRVPPPGGNQSDRQERGRHHLKGMQDSMAAREQATRALRGLVASYESVLANWRGMPSMPRPVKPSPIIVDTTAEPAGFGGEVDLAAF